MESLERENGGRERECVERLKMKREGGEWASRSKT